MKLTVYSKNTQKNYFLYYCFFKICPKNLFSQKMPLSCLLEQNLGSQCYTYQSGWIKVSFPEMKTKHAFHTPRHLWCPYVYVFVLHMAKNKFQASKSSKVSFLSNLYLQYIWHFWVVILRPLRISKHELTLWHYRIVKEKQWKMNQRTYISVRSCHLQQWILGKTLNRSKEAVFETSWLIQGDNQDLC